MSKLDEIIERVGEIARSYPNLDFGYLLVSASTLQNLLMELNMGRRYMEHGYQTGDKMESLALQTHNGQLYVKPEPDLEDDDFLLMDRSGNRYSYKYFFVNELIEKILLRGKS